jgi:hypothetical protein
MALLATNYIHLCKETLWLFGNIVNSESVVVQVSDVINVRFGRKVWTSIYVSYI